MPRKTWDGERLARAEKLRASGMTLSDISVYFGMGRTSYARFLRRERAKRTVGRAVEGAGSETRKTPEGVS